MLGPLTIIAFLSLPVIITLGLHLVMAKKKNSKQEHIHQLIQKHQENHDHDHDQAA